VTWNHEAREDENFTRRAANNSMYKEIFFAGFDRVRLIFVPFVVSSSNV
jgi:hypothetical protein